MNKPFLLKPSGKDYLWGGERLNTDFGKNIPMSPLAETWECSTHPDGPSYVASGEYSGMTLAELLAAHPDMLGTKYEKDGELPILVKFIDAKSDLSVQVHPSDEYAAEHENGQKGKSEMWYVVDATPNAHLVYGLSRDCTREEFRAAIENGTLEDYLQRMPVKKGDMLYIEAGTVHAICNGVLVAEVQENSNLTYRIYDYNRRDKNGNLRELHIDKALAVSSLKSTPLPKREANSAIDLGGASRESLCQNQYFTANLLAVSSSLPYSAGKESFVNLLCLEGEGSISFDGESITFKKGDSIFYGADSVDTKLCGNAKFLEIYC